MNLNKKICLSLGLSLCLFIWPRVSSAQERIIEFDSLITVNQDGSLIVEEKITAEALGQEIKRGIYRDFPTRYKDRLGNNYKVGFEILEVLRDGQMESYHTENLSNGIRIYFGKSDYYLPQGQYTYTFKYKTTRQLGFFADHDELYWNVTGQGWIFPIEKASAAITLPQGITADQIKLDGYTGPADSQAKDFTSKVISNQPYFETTGTLNPYEGLTIVVSWPKGFIEEPTQNDKIIYWLKDNASLIIGLLGLIVMILYYLIIWSKVGKDPKKGTIIPQYEPPTEMSAAGMRYLKKMSFDNKAFVAQIIDLAIKGQILIEKEKAFLGSKHALHKNKKVGNLNAVETEILAALFSAGDKIELDNKNYKDIQAAKKVLSDSLKKEIKNKLFKINLKYFFIGLGLTLLTLFLIFSLGAKSLSPITVFIIVLLFVINLIFLWLLKTPTPEGRKILDHIEGFKWFLTVTEKDRMNFHNPPQKTPELFEKFLPYALALGVENKWAEQFSKVFAQLEQAGQPYSPAWYPGNVFKAASLGSFTNSLGSSFAHAVSSASTPPGSSSGSGGGAGGGGGGGGGGGW